MRLACAALFSNDTVEKDTLLPIVTFQCSGLWPVVLGLSANARQARLFVPLSKVRQGLGVAGAPSARHNLLKFRHETCKRRDGGADLMV